MVKLSKLEKELLAKLTTLALDAKGDYEGMRGDRYFGFSAFEKGTDLRIDVRLCGSQKSLTAYLNGNRILQAHKNYAALGAPDVVSLIWDKRPSKTALSKLVGLASTYIKEADLTKNVKTHYWT